MTNRVLNSFNEYFEWVPADTDDLRKEAYKLRHQVYCLETGYENPDDFKDGMETDDFDSHSVHYLIRHRRFGVYMATVRLILPCPENLEKPFPIEKYSHIENYEPIKRVCRNNLAEASRFCVSKDFRRRKYELTIVPGINLETENYLKQIEFSEYEVRLFPHITLNLIACLIRMSREHNITDWFLIMEPSVIRVFGTFGIKFVTIGPLVDYHGIRRPCIIHVEDLLVGVANKNKDFWAVLTNNGRFWDV